MHRFILDGKRTEELTAQVAQLRRELEEANLAAGKGAEELTAQVAQLRRELEEELSRVVQLRAMLEEELSRGFWRRLFGLRSQQASFGLRSQQASFGLQSQQTSEERDSVRDRAREDMERIREQTRGRIAFALIFTLVGVVLVTLVYIAVLSISGVLGTEEVINVVHGLGTTLLAPIVGLIGAVIGFYYGGQTAVQGTEQARLAATETASHVADKAANQAADKTVRAVTDSTTEATKKVTEAADKATRAAQDVQEAVNNHPEKTNG
jgi:hypothetical protein